MANTYDQTSKNVGYSLAHSMFDRMQPYFQCENGSVLDIGIGTGQASEAFAKAGWTVVGIDGSQKMLDQVRIKGISSVLHLADLSSGEIPLHNHKFEAIVCIGVFEFIRDRRIFLKNVARLSRSGSLFALAIRDPALNPQFTHMMLGDLDIDKFAYETNGVIAVHHRWSDVQADLEQLGFRLLSEEQLIAYRSPTQGFDTKNRLVLFGYTAND